MLFFIYGNGGGINKVQEKLSNLTKYDNFYMLSHAPLQLTETTCYFNAYGHVHSDNKFVNNATSGCYSVERIGYRPALLFEKN